MIHYWEKFTKIDQRMALPALVGLVAVAVNLVLTLNFIASIVIGVFVAAMLFLYKSFSRGWLFLLAVAFLFPATRVGSGDVFLFDLFLIILIIVSLIQLALKDKKITTNPLVFPFFLFILIGIAMIVFGGFSGAEINKNVFRILLSVATFWFLLSAFQYFFQTRRRIKRFFMVLVAVGVIHSIFGILAFIFSSPTSSGLGISSGKIQHILFHEVSRQITGFFGVGLQGEIGANPLAALLLITIMITVGFILVNIQQEKEVLKKIDSDGNEGEENLDLEEMDNEWENQIFGEYIQKDYKKQRYIFIGLTAIQVIALFLTFSYSTFLFLIIAIFILGILLKNKHVIAIAAALIIALTVIFPGFMGASLETNNWFVGAREIGQRWFMGNGMDFANDSQEILTSDVQISNSYIYIWNYFGLIGFVILVYVLGRYFLDIYYNFQETQRAARIWYMVIFAIFVAVIFEGITSNILIIGPTAVIFWLLYGVVINLRHKNIEFGLTETKISS